MVLLLYTLHLCLEVLFLCLANVQLILVVIFDLVQFLELLTVVTLKLSELDADFLEDGKEAVNQGFDTLSRWQILLLQRAWEININLNYFFANFRYFCINIILLLRQIVNIFLITLYFKFQFFHFLLNFNHHASVLLFFRLTLIKILFHKQLFLQQLQASLMITFIFNLSLDLF